MKRIQLHLVYVNSVGDNAYYLHDNGIPAVFLYNDNGFKVYVTNQEVDDVNSPTGEYLVFTSDYYKHNPIYFTEDGNLEYNVYQHGHIAHVFTGNTLKQMRKVLVPK